MGTDYILVSSFWDCAHRLCGKEAKFMASWSKQLKKYYLLTNQIEAKFSRNINMTLLCFPSTVHYHQSNANRSPPHFGDVVKSDHPMKQLERNWSVTTITWQFKSGKPGQNVHQDKRRLARIKRSSHSQFLIGPILCKCRFHIRAVWLAPNCMVLIGQLRVFWLIVMEALWLVGDANEDIAEQFRLDRGGLSPISQNTIQKASL